MRRMKNNDYQKLLHVNLGEVNLFLCGPQISDDSKKKM